MVAAGRLASGAASSAAATGGACLGLRSAAPHVLQLLRSPGAPAPAAAPPRACASSAAFSATPPAAGPAAFAAPEYLSFAMAPLVALRAPTAGCQAHAPSSGRRGLVRTLATPSLAAGGARGGSSSSSSSSSRDSERKPWEQSSRDSGGRAAAGDGRERRRSDGGGPGLGGSGSNGRGSSERRDYRRSGGSGGGYSGGGGFSGGGGGDARETGDRRRPAADGSSVPREWRSAASGAAPAPARRAAAAPGAGPAPRAAAAAAATVAVTATAAAATAAVAAPRPAPPLPSPSLPPPPPPPPAAAAPSGAALAAAEAAGVYPTHVPRNAGITDGEWGARDAAMVAWAQRDAAERAGGGGGAAGAGAAAETAEAAAGAAAAGAKEAAEAEARAAGAPPLVVLAAEPAELAALAAAHGQPRFRAEQLQRAVMGGARSVEDITTIPKPWRAALAAAGVRTGRSRLHRSVGDEDGTRKFLLQLHDGRIIETVGIPTEDRLTVCVSSQVGCPMRCTFCATGKGGFARNLAAHEIVDQVLTVQEAYGRRVSNVVFMGMGEPLLNLPAVLRAYTALNQQVGIGGAFITVSTVGVPNAIARLAAAPGVRATLAVSLHAPSQALRERLVPSAKAYPLGALMEDCVGYFRRTGRRVTFEYTLLSGVNDELAHAQELAALLQQYGMGGSHVNIIPWNPVDESAFARPSRNRVYAFRRALEAGGVNVTIRETRGLEAAAACGQLRNQFQKSPLPDFMVPT